MDEINGAPNCTKNQPAFIKNEDPQSPSSNPFLNSVTIKKERNHSSSSSNEGERGDQYPREMVKSEDEKDSDYEESLDLSQSDIEKEFEKSEKDDQDAIFEDNDTTAYKCNICLEVFHAFTEFRLHRKKHFIDKRTCKLCETVCQSISKLEIHMNAHLGLKPYKCSECEKKFISKNQLKLHMRSHSDEKRYTCMKCGKAFRHLGSLRSHVATHNDIKLLELQCQNCGENCSSVETYRRHLKQHGLASEINCQLCNKTFLSDRHLQTHLNSHKELKFPCEYCGRIYQSLYRLKRHIKRAHIPNVCEDCDKVFYDRAMYTKHRKEHAEGKPTACIHCGKHFDKQKNLSEHVRLQHKEDGNLHKCDLCDKEFINASLLKNHVKTHDKCFKCKFCDKLFSSRYNLETHSVTHTGARNHKCNICGKGYSTKSSLKNHHATHTEVRSYKCDMCPKLFKTNRRLYVHKFSHATEEKFQCDICQARFRVKQYLKYHMIKHSAIKPYECKACNKRFKHKKSWEKHAAHDRLVKIVRKEMHPCNICTQSFDSKTLMLEHIRSFHDLTLCGALSQYESPPAEYESLY